MFGSCCAKAENQNNPWFAACRNGDVQFVTQNLAEFAPLRESERFQIIEQHMNQQDAMDSLAVSSFFVPFYITVPGFTGLHYAIFYNQKRLIQILAPYNILMNTLDEVKLPTQQQLPFSQTTPECINSHQVFERSVVIPSNSSPLQLSILLNRLQICDLLLELLHSTLIAQQIVLAHVNNQLFNDLMYLVKLGSDEAFQVLCKHGKLLTKKEFKYRNVMGLNATTIAIREGQAKFLKYFLGLCNDKDLLKVVQKHLKSTINVDYLQLTRQNRQISQKHNQVYKLAKLYFEKKYPPAPDWLQTSPIRETMAETQLSDESTTKAANNQNNSNKVEKSQKSNDNSSQDYLQPLQLDTVFQIAESVKATRKTTVKEQYKTLKEDSDGIQQVTRESQINKSVNQVTQMSAANLMWEDTRDQMLEKSQGSSQNRSGVNYSQSQSFARSSQTNGTRLNTHKVHSIVE
ncbi:Conserved_hypothetical protein [Hexamita inflata]|uniref:Uncharacterized protein n=1 Tax=Hexamita inflata TaxID=28002 RepID=A0AA86PNX2_9EUKA|nr:Conserved hypothetical protein [Hexamita inflata]